VSAFGPAGTPPKWCGVSDRWQRERPRRFPMGGPSASRRCGSPPGRVPSSSQLAGPASWPARQPGRSGCRSPDSAAFEQASESHGVFAEPAQRRCLLQGQQPRSDVRPHVLGQHPAAARPWRTRSTFLPVCIAISSAVHSNAASCVSGGPMQHYPAQYSRGLPTSGRAVRIFVPLLLALPVRDVVPGGQGAGVVWAERSHPRGGSVQGSARRGRPPVMAR
jgi:hypothetical protein